MCVNKGIRSSKQSVKLRKQTLCIPKFESPKQQFLSEKIERLIENEVSKQKNRIEASVKLDMLIITQTI